MKIMKMTRRLSDEGIPHLIFVYVGGHGATSNEKQIYLLNSDDPKKAVFQLEYKLRYLYKEPGSKTRVFAIYDCCRVPLSGMPDLAIGRGGGLDADPTDEDEEEVTYCKYFHIQACGPGGIADADGGFA